MLALLVAFYLGGVVGFVLAAVLVAAGSEHARPRAGRRRSNSPADPSSVQGEHPEIEVGWTTAPGAAPPGRPIHSQDCTARAEHIFRSR
jgi:hypothetical protein